MKQIFFLASVILIISSCKKTENTETTTLTGKYQTGNTLIVSAPVMYIKNLQITDTAKINSYLRAHNAISNFVYTPLQVISDTLLTIKFGINDSANFTVHNSSTFYTARKISYPDNQLLIKRYDSSMDIISPYPASPTFLRCDTLISLTLKTFPLVYFIPIGPDRAVRVAFGGFPMIYQNGALSLNLVTYFINTTWSYSNSVGNCNGLKVDFFGIKKQDIEANLTSTDTVVIQEKRIMLSKVQ